MWGGSAALLWRIPRLGGGPNQGLKLGDSDPQHHPSWRRKLPDGNCGKHQHPLLRSFHHRLLFHWKQFCPFFLVKIFLELFISLHCFETSVPTSWIWFICRPRLGNLHNHQKSCGGKTEGGFSWRDRGDDCPCQVRTFKRHSNQPCDPLQMAPRLSGSYWNCDRLRNCLLLHQRRNGRWPNLRRQESHAGNTSAWRG